MTEQHQDNREDFLRTQARHVSRCLKEARMAVLIWLVGLVWCSSVMITTGYIPPAERPDVPELVLGIPSWVFWGLFLPWFVMTAASWWFALCYMKDDEPYIDFPRKQDSDDESSPSAR